MESHGQSILQVGQIQKMGVWSADGMQEGEHVRLTRTALEKNLGQS